MTEPQTFTFTDDGAIPNSKLPLLVYRQAVPADPASIEELPVEHQGDRSEVTALTELIFLALRAHVHAE